MNEQKFFRCKSCGNFISLSNGTNSPMACCGSEMEELIPNSVDASREKHVPVTTVSGDVVTIKIGMLPHPMEEAHHIEFIYLQTKNGGQLRSLKIGGKPSAVFKLVDDVPVEAFAYCNLHGLWSSKID